MYFNIPGLRNSKGNHWQTLWEKQYPHLFTRIQQNNWEQPDCTTWTQQLESTLSAHDLSDAILIGHSVGCATIVNWFGKYRHTIRGALLVAPSDVERPDYPQYITGFTPLFLDRLSFPSIVVASTDDHVVDFTRAQYFAKIWGSDLVKIEKGGHLEKGIGTNNWQEGIQLLTKF